MDADCDLNQGWFFKIDLSANAVRGLGNRLTCHVELIDRLDTLPDSQREGDLGEAQVRCAGINDPD